ncbi:MAG: alpha-L-fucosidase, partial [bacterium]|nr:alpha-L-fucosidase [Candidatus Colisoma equi]
MICAIAAHAALDAARIEWFKDQKLALMMHFGLYSETGIIESWPLSDKDAHWARVEIERDVATNGFKEAYFAMNRSFNPVRFRPDEWAEEAVRGGFKYVIFTTKHHDGFCLYDTKYTDYKVTDASCPFSTNPNADIVKAYFNACRKRGLGIGAYFSKADWHHEDFWENRGIGHVTDRGVTYDTKANPEKWNRFKAFFRKQLLELVNGYGPLDIVWLDGGWMPKGSNMDLDVESVIAEARKTTPGLIAVDRYGQNSCEDVTTPEQFVPGAVSSNAWESCVTMAANWGYHYDDFYKSPRELIHMLVDVVAKGGNLA